MKDLIKIWSILESIIQKILEGSNCTTLIFVQDSWRTLELKDCEIKEDPLSFSQKYLKSLIEFYQGWKKCSIKHHLIMIDYASYLSPLIESSDWNKL